MHTGKKIASGAACVFLAVVAVILMDISAPDRELSGSVYAQAPTATPTPCPDGGACFKKRYATRTQNISGDESIQGLFGVAGVPSDPCVDETQINYSLWVVDDQANGHYEWVEIGTIKLASGSHYIFTGCSICTSFWGNHGPLPYNGPTSLRIERHPVAFGPPVGNGCWKWFVDDDKVRDTCEEAAVVDDVLTGGDRGIVGGETDSYYDDLGVQSYDELAIKLSESASPLFEVYSPDESAYWIYTHSERYASVWVSPLIQLQSDTHFAGLRSFCDGRPK